MKRLTVLILSVLMVCLMAGCGNASGKLSDGNKVLFQVGKNKVTKNDFYKVMRDYDAGDFIIKQAAKAVVNAEMETTDQIKADAKKQFDETIAEYDDLKTALEKLGYESEEELMEDVIDSVKADLLIDKYIEENWDNLVSKYAPLKIRVLTLTQADNGDDFKATAANALADLKAGETFDAVAGKYMDEKSDAYKQTRESLYVTTSSGYDNVVKDYLKEVTTPGLSEVLTNSAGTVAYVVQVTNNNISQLKDEFTAHLKGLSTISEEMYSFYLKKHNFTLYDIDLYNIIKQNYQSYLVQD